MDCPVCKNVPLAMSERQGIEIDYCSNCRGVWLDRGELDKIIERSMETVPAAAAAQPSPEPRYAEPDQRYPLQSGHGKYPRQKKKREGFLSDLFDF